MPTTDPHHPAATAPPKAPPAPPVTTTEEAISRILESAPPLSEETISRLARLLGFTGTTRTTKQSG